METNTRRLSSAKNISDTERVASVVGGGTLMAWGLARRRWDGFLMAAIGSSLVYRGATGHCGIYKSLGMNTARRSGRNVSVPYELGIRIDEEITINKPAEEVYRFWRNLENLPKFMRNIECVKEIDNRTSHWVTRGPANSTIEWDAEIINEIENELIGWRSLGGSQVAHAGSVHFDPAVDGRGTVVKVELQYEPPGGAVGAAVAKLLGKNPDAQIQEDLRRLKQLLETGEIPGAADQPGARKNPLARVMDTIERRSQPVAPKKGWNRDVVSSASEESFPASDPPSWTPEKL